jgi:hypothetical protein
VRPPSSALPSLHLLSSSYAWQSPFGRRPPAVLVPVAQVRRDPVLAYQHLLDQMAHQRKSFFLAARPVHRKELP